MPRHGDLYAEYQAAAHEQIELCHQPKVTKDQVAAYLGKAQVYATLAQAEAEILAARIIKGQKGV